MSTESIPAPRMCAQCRGPIATTDPRAIYCSNKCRVAAAKARTLAALAQQQADGPICAHCGKPFTTIKKRQKTCSRECARALGVKRLAEKRATGQDTSHGG